MAKNKDRTEAWSASFEHSTLGLLGLASSVLGLILNSAPYTYPSEDYLSKLSIIESMATYLQVIGRLVETVPTVQTHSFPVRNCGVFYGLISASAPISPELNFGLNCLFCFLPLGFGCSLDWGL